MPFLRCPEPGFTIEEVVDYSRRSDDPRSPCARAEKRRMIIVDMSEDAGPTRTLLREELYQELFTRPACQLAPALGVSNKVLDGVCEELAIPKPTVGDWTKKQPDQPLPRPPLPEFDGPVGVVFRRLDARDLIDSELVEKFEHLINTVRDRANRVYAVPDLDPERHHPLVRRTAALLEGAPVNQYGRLRPEGTEPCLDLRVSGGALPRASAIADVIVKTFEVLGCAVHTRRTGRARMETTVEILGAEVPWQLFERSLKWQPTEADVSACNSGTPKRPPDMPLYQPNGELVLKMDPNLRGQVRVDQRDWGDASPRHQVETQLNDFVVSVIEAALFTLCADRLRELKNAVRIRCRQDGEDWVPEKSERAGLIAALTLEPDSAPDSRADPDLGRFAAQARQELAERDKALEWLFSRLQRLRPQLALDAVRRFGDRVSAARLLLRPLNCLGGKSALQYAMETDSDPLAFAQSLEAQE